VSGGWFGLAGALLVLGTGTVWFRRARQVRIPADKRSFFGAMGLGALLGVVAFFQGASGLGALAAGVAVIAGGSFLGLQLQAAQDRREPAVRVGEPMPAVTASDDCDRAFDLASLAGRPYLLKFFRGHW